MWNETDDFALALQLQNELNTDTLENKHRDGFHDRSDTNTIKPTEKSSKNMSLVDPQWELIDPNPDVRMLFLEFNERFFWGKLSCVEVRWSPRMTLCAGVCVYEGRGGLCSVRLSTPLLKLRPRKDLIETLLHEMIHAYLFVTDNNKDHDGHGPEFHKHMYRINGETGTNISVYHSFHDEVDSYRQHWWRCDGKCRSKPPYFGYVKRAMNRVPSARDPWWPSHQMTCGGTYTKVKEPEGYGEKKKKKEKNSEKNVIEQSKDTADIRNMFEKKNIASGSKGNDKIVNSKGSSDTALSQQSNANIAGFKHIDASGTLSVLKENNKNTNLGQALRFINKNPGVNIAGFKRDNPSAGLEVYKGLNSIQDSFSGIGKTIGGSDKLLQNSSSTNIVRRIPGIGIIETERRLVTALDNTSLERKVCTQECKSESEDEDLLIFSPKEKNIISNNAKRSSSLTGEHSKKENSPKSGVMTWIENGLSNSVNAKRNETSFVDVSDSDSEFDKSLKKFATNQVRKKKARSSKKLPASVQPIDRFVVKNGSKKQVGTVISLPGFKSVSGGKRTPVRNLGDRKGETNYTTEDEGTNKINFNHEQNKRAHSLISSESESGDECNINALEKQSLASVIHRKKRRTNENTIDISESAIDRKESVLSSNTGNIPSVTNGASSSGANNAVINTAAVANHNVDKVACPVCGSEIEVHLINGHLDTCLSKGLL